MNQPIDFIDSPERNLWLAVIERALKDYCFYFDRLQQTNFGKIHSLPRLDQPNRAGMFYQRAIAELDRLRWFIFDQEQVPFNLSYLAVTLYDGEEGIITDMRKFATRQFKLQLDESRKAGLFPPLIKYIEEHTSANQAEAAKHESKLRHKRFRLTTDV